MKKAILMTVIILAVAAVSRAQTSAVTATITDSDNQTWNNGSYTISFVQSSGNSAPPIWNGTPLDSAHKLFKGFMSPSGVLTVSIPDNNFVTPSGSSWLFVLCPYSSGSCSQVQTPVIGSSVDLSSTLSGGITAPRFPALQGAYGYLDVEVTPIPPPGGFYFNVTNNLQRVWNGSSWQNGGGGGGGGSVGPGTTNYISCFNTTTSVANCGDAITDIAGVVTIPAVVEIGEGSGPASIALPSGAASGCPTPVAGSNIVCSDGTLNTLDESLNGADYVPIVTPISGSGNPAGSCSAGQVYTDTATGNAWTCKGTAWIFSYINTTNGINAPQFLKSPLLDPVFNSVIYADGFASSGGSYRGTWSNATAYTAFDTVTFSGIDYITPFGNINIPPNTSFSPGSAFFWVPFNATGVGATATMADKAFFWAYAQLQLGATSFSINAGIDVEFGDAIGGYTKNGDWAMPVNTEGYTLSLHGKGRGMTYINQGLTTTAYMVTQASNAAALGQEIRGITFNANSLAGGCLSAHIRRSFYEDLVCFNPTQQAGGSIQQAMYFGQSGDGYEVTIRHILVRTPTFSSLAPAYGTCPVSGGAITFASCTITSGGANLNTPPQGLFAYISGTNGGTSHQPCTSMPNQPTFTLASGVLTGMTAGASAGSGCGGTIYFQVFEAGTIPFLYYFGDTDSTVEDVVSTGDATTACAKDQNAFTHFTHEHQYCRAPFQIQELGHNWHTTIQTDSPVQYALDLTGGGSIFLDSGYEQAGGASVQGASDVLVESSATYSYFGPSNCGTLQTAAGYNKFTIKNLGPATTSSAFPTGFAIYGPQLNCDGSNTLWGQLIPGIGPDTTNTSNAVLVDEFACGGGTTGIVGCLGWLISNIGGAPTIGNLASSANHPGVSAVTSSATSGQGGTLFLAPAFGNGVPFLPVTVSNWNSEFIAGIQTATNVSWRLGFIGGTFSTAIPTNGVYFRYDTSLSDTHIMICSDLAGTETCTSSGQTPTGGAFYDLFMSSSTVGTLTFQVGANSAVTLCASGCTINTTLPTVVLGPGGSIVTQTTATTSMYLDYFKWSQQGLVR